MVFLKSLEFLKVAKCGKFAVDCVSNGMISKNGLFRPTNEVFLAKENTKLLALEKLENMKECFSEEKTFSSF